MAVAGAAIPPRRSHACHSPSLLVRVHVPQVEALIARAAADFPPPPGPDGGPGTGMLPLIRLRVRGLERGWAWTFSRHNGTRLAVTACQHLHTPALQSAALPNALQEYGCSERALGLLATGPECADTCVHFLETLAREPLARGSIPPCTDPAPRPLPLAPCPSPGRLHGLLHRQLAAAGPALRGQGGQPARHAAVDQGGGTQVSGGPMGERCGGRHARCSCASVGRFVQLHYEGSVLGMQAGFSSALWSCTSRSMAWSCMRAFPR